MSSPRLSLSRVAGRLVAGVAAGAAFLVATATWGGPPVDPSSSAPAASPSAKSEAPAAPASESPAPPAVESALPSPDSLRGRMEAAMEKVGALALEAKEDRDLVRVACVRDKQERAADVLALGTGELLIVRDPGSEELARGFAHEKLLAAAEQLEAIVEDARRCAGDEGPEAEDDATRTDADEPMSIPRNDPTLGFGDSPVPPAGADGWPPVSSPYY